MKEVGAFEAKNTLGGLLDQVASGEEIVITRHGKPVARLVPVGGGADRNAARQALARIRARHCAGFDWQALKAERDGGRP